MEVFLKGFFLNILFIGIVMFILFFKYWKLLSILNIEDKIDE